MTTQCNERCTDATGGACKCECGGANHGLIAHGGTLANLRPSDRTKRPNPAQMGATEINRELDALQRQSGRLTRAMIEAGRGNERPSETFPKGEAGADPLSIEAVSISKRENLLRREVERRAGPGMSRLPDSNARDRRMFGAREKKPFASGYKGPRAPETRTFERHLRYDEGDYIPRLSSKAGPSDKVKGLIVGDMTAVAIHKDRLGYGVISHQLPLEALPDYEGYADDLKARSASFAVRERIAADFQRANPRVKVDIVRPDENLRERIDAFEKSVRK